MDMNQFRKHLAKSQKLTEASGMALPAAIAKYKESKSPTFAETFDAGREVAKHPAVKQHLDAVLKNMPSGSKTEIAAYVNAIRTLPRSVVDVVAKDFDLRPIDVTVAYSAYTGD